MSTDIALREPATVALSNDQLQYISRTEFVPPGLRGNLPAILACVATGRSLGLPDMTALRSIHIIDGKATFSAELMVQLVRKRGHSIIGDITDRSVAITGTRADNGDTMNVTWTLEMAERAGLLNKSNWKKYPEAMLWARAASQLCRMLFADCFAGQTYTTEELDGVNEEATVTGDELLDGSAEQESAPAEMVDEPGVGELPDAGADFISAPQRTRLWTIAQANGVDEPRLRELVEYVAGVQSTKEITRDKYDALVAAVEAESLPFE